MNHLPADNCMCDKTSCQDEVQQLKKQISEHENEIKKQKDVYRSSLIRNFGLDCMIEDLEQQIDANVQMAMYTNFESQISKQTIMLLQSFNLTNSDDCKFVTAILRDLYGDNILLLQTTTVSGRGIDKIPIPSGKFNLIEKFFDARLEYSSKYEPNHLERKKNLNKLLKSAIETINRSVV